MSRTSLVLVVALLCGCAAYRPGLRKSEWVLALYRNDTDQDVTMWIRGKSQQGGFVAHPHQVREDELSGDDRDVYVFPNIGPRFPPSGMRAIAHCTVDFRQLSQGGQYLPPSSPKRHLYFRITPGRIEQISSFEGHGWKIDIPFSGPDYKGAIAGITTGSNQTMQLTPSRTAFTFNHD